MVVATAVSGQMEIENGVTNILAMARVLTCFLLVTPFSAHCISDQKVRTVMVRARVRARVRIGDVVVRKVGGRFPLV